MKLVVGYLATPGGADALALALRFARTLGAEVEICIVLPPDTGLPALVPRGGFEKALARQARGWLEKALAAVPADVVAHSHLSFDESFTDGLIHEAVRLEAEAIVVGGSGGGLAGSYSLGSVVNELLYSSPVPVAVAPRGTRESKIERVREVTCALGTRKGADRLLDTAVQASKAAGTPLRLVSLVALDPTFGSLRSDSDAVRKHALDHARKTLETAKASLPEGFPVTSTVVDGPTVEAAVSKLEWQDGDVLMVGSSRLSAPRRIFLSSTAAKMLRVLHVPMVVVPRDDGGDDEG
ncbi:universal stress protein [Mycobacterium sp. 141]|uniref:universal stress protein n=1 Tax=Mycobacterium sp. 141 TaxID=1120797 RepID=UPI00035E1382|nr:universal stress protein [Mycobacterium sp. 141]